MTKKKTKKNDRALTEEFNATTTTIFSGFDDTTTKQITPKHIASLLKQGQNNIVPELLSIAELMEERDPHYGSVLGTRKRAVLGIDYSIEPTSQNTSDLKLVDDVLEMINALDIYALFEDLLDAIGKGFSVVEIVWKIEHGKYVPAQLLYCDPRLFTYDNTGRNLRLLSDDNVDGEELAQYKFITHFAKLKSGKKCRDGVARSALWSWMIKNYTISDWVSFCESFGVPLRIGKYSASATDTDKKTLLKALRSLGRDSAAMMPESMNIDFNSSGDIRGNATVFSDLAKYIDEQLSKLILGQTMTTDSGSSQAQATVHNDVRKDIIVADARKLAGTITKQLIRYFVELNYGTNIAIPKFKFNTDDSEDITALVDNVTKLVDLGLEVSAEEMRSKLGLKAMENGDIALARTNMPPTNTPPALNKADVVCGCGVNKSLNKAETIDMSEEEMIQALVDSVDSAEPYSMPIKQALNESQSFEEFQSKLPAILEQIINGKDAVAMNEKLSQALFAGRLNGYIAGKPKE